MRKVLALIVMLVGASIVHAAENDSSLLLKRAQTALSDIAQESLTSQDRTRVQYAIVQISSYIASEASVHVVATTCECSGSYHDDILTQTKLLSNGDKIFTDIGKYKISDFTGRSKCQDALQTTSLCSK